MFSNGFTWQGFLDNLIYPLIVASIVGIATFVRARLLQKKKKQKAPVIVLKIDEKISITLQSGKIDDKLSVLRGLIRAKSVDGRFIKIKPAFPLKRLKGISKEEFNLKILEFERQIEKRIEILLMRTISIETENISSIKYVIERLLMKYDSNVTGKTKIDIYRLFDPRICFSIYITRDELNQIAMNENKTVDEMKLQLRIPTLTTMGIFSKELLLKYVVPGLIDEIYRISKYHNFDLETAHWENIHAYEVGLG